MNLNMIQPKKDIEDFLLKRIKNYETLIEQTHGKPQELLEFKLDKARQTFFFQSTNSN